MACNECEIGFQSYQSVVVSVEKSGTNARLYVENKGRNIVMIRRIVLGYKTAGGAGFLFLRPPNDSVSWAYPSAFLETGLKAFYYSFNASSAQIVQAQADYIEIAGRSRSCPTNF